MTDLRIQIVFTRVEVSAFTIGLEREIAQLDGATVPWEQACSTEFDLAVCAGNEGPLEDIMCPLLVLPHGPGYTKDVNTWSPRLTSPSTETVLAFTDPAAPPPVPLSPRLRHELVGDICWQNLCDGIPERGHFREALGVLPGQRLITISSTWGPQSLFACQPLLAEHLLSMVDHDDTVIAQIMHANIGSGHGPRQIDLWTARAVDSGLCRIDPAQGWRATVLASDIVLGDHGSVTYYAARLGIPVFVGSSTDELRPGTALADTFDAAPRFEDAHAARTLCDDTPPDRWGPTSAPTATIDAAQRLRALLFHLIDLPEPPRPPSRRIPGDPLFARRQPTSFLAHATFLGREDDSVVVRRRPAGIERREALHADQFLVTSTQESDVWLRRAADVVVGPPPGPATDSFPHARTTVVPLGYGRWRATRRGADAPLYLSCGHDDVDTGLTLAAAVQLWDVDSQPPEVLHVLCGPRSIMVRASRADSPAAPSLSHALRQSGRRRWPAQFSGVLPRPPDAPEAD